MLISEKPLFLQDGESRNGEKRARNERINHQ